MTKRKLEYISLGKCVEMISDKFPDSVSGLKICVEALRSNSVSCKGYYLSNISQDDQMRYLSIRDSEKASKDFTHFEAKRGSVSILTKLGEHDPFIDSLAFDEDGRGEIHTYLREISIRLKDLELYLEKQFFWPPSGKEGRSRKAEAWLQFAISLLRLERTGLLNINEFPSPHALRDAICDKMDHTLDHRTIDFDTGIIFNMFIRNSDGQREIPQGAHDQNFDVRDALAQARAQSKFVEAATDPN